MKMNVIKLRIILWHILALTVVFFIYRSVIPSGHISYTYDFNKKVHLYQRLHRKKEFAQLRVVVKR